MRRVEVWSMTAVLAVGLGAVAVRAADDHAESTKSSECGRSWWNPFASGSRSQEKKPAATKPSGKTAEPAITKRPASAAKTTTAVDEAKAERAQEEKTLFRRLQACDRLKEIAMQTKDEDLLRRAEEMDERTWTLYAQHTAHLRSRPGEFEADAKGLEKHLRASQAETQRLEIPVRKIADKEVDR